MTNSDKSILSGFLKVCLIRSGSVAVGFLSFAAMLLSLLVLLLNFPESHPWYLLIYIWLGPPALLFGIVLAFIDALEAHGKRFAVAALILFSWYVGGLLVRGSFVGLGP